VHNLPVKDMNMPIPNHGVSHDGRRSLKYFPFEMPSWWGGRLKTLRRIPKRDIVDAVVVSLFLLVLSALMVVPMVTNL
jgi:hypothetical protein